MAFVLKRRSVLPGFGLGLGYTVFYLSLIVLIPLSAVALRSTELTWAEFSDVIKRRDVASALWLSFFAAFVAACINVVFGLAVAWVMVRYRFWGRRLLDAMIDLPFALPTAVAGIALTTLYAKNGWAGRPIDWLFTHHWLPAIPWAGWKGFTSSFATGAHWQSPLRLDWHTQVAYSPIGVVVALTFIGLPFVVRTVQPVLADLTKETEEAAASLGAGRWKTFRHVIFPEIWPALVTGFALALARAVGEYGSVVFIAGNLPGKSEIAPLLIIKRLEEYEYPAATSIAVVMLSLSFVLLLVINILQRWLSRHGAAT